MAGATQKQQNWFGSKNFTLPEQVDSGREGFCLKGVFGVILLFHVELLKFGCRAHVPRETYALVGSKSAVWDFVQLGDERGATSLRAQAWDDRSITRWPLMKPHLPEVDVAASVSFGSGAGVTDTSLDRQYPDSN